MKPNQNQLVLAGLVIGIIVLLGIVFWILSNKETIGVSLPKEFANELHSGIQQEWEINNALVQDIDDLAVPKENRDQFFLLQNVARSYQRELEWLKGKEAVSFAGMQTENNLQAREAMKKEIAYYVLFQYLTLINHQVTQTVSQPGFDRDETITRTEQELQNPQTGSLLTESKLEELAQESGLTSEQIGSAITGTVNDFLEFKKTDFGESVTSYEKAVVGEQIITWLYLLQSNPVPAN
jgi:hypothetical protein